MKQWLIVAELPEPLRTEHNQLRTEVDHWSSRWLPPHVTIVRPFSLELTGLAITEIVRPITVTAQILRWAIFRNPGNNVLYLEPTQEPFRTLRRDLFERAPELLKRGQAGDPFGQFEKDPIFHITIAAGVPNDEIDRIYSKVSPVRAGGHKGRSYAKGLGKDIEPLFQSSKQDSSNGVSQKTHMNVFLIHNLSLYSMENGGYWALEG